MSFPLLRLPLLASVNVIQNFSVTQIINLIQTSSKVQRLVKISKYPVQLYVRPKSITLKHPMNPEELQVLIVVRSELEEQTERIRFQQDHIQGVFTEWKNEVEGYRRIIDFLVGNFTVKCISLDKWDSDDAVFIEYLEYSKSRGIKLDRVRIWDRSGKEGMTERMLSVCSHASYLKLALKCARNFKGFQEFQVDRFDFHLIGEGFTVDHMCALINCSEISVKNLRHWTSVNFNQFLQFWIKNTGRLRKVYVNAYYLDIDPDIAMNGIKSMKLDQHATFQFQMDNGMRARANFFRQAILLQSY